TVRESERQPFLRRMVQLIGRDVVAEQIAAVVSEPHLVCRGMPVKADAVADAAGKNLGLASVRLHAQDRREAWIVGTLAHVARAADRHIEQSVWSEANELLAVM